MSLRAFGFNAAIEVFDHHLVITRRNPGFIVDGPPAEQLIPLSSIKSLQFYRPGFAKRGRLVLIIEGGSTGRSGSAADDNTVFFGEPQLMPFEQVVQAIKSAIAMPSLERIAMAARNDRLAGDPRPATGNQLGPVSTQSQGYSQEHHNDQRWLTSIIRMITACPSSSASS